MVERIGSEWKYGMKWPIRSILPDKLIRRDRVTMLNDGFVPVAIPGAEVTKTVIACSSPGANLAYARDKHIARNRQHAGSAQNGPLQLRG